MRRFFRRSNAEGTVTPLQPSGTVQSRFRLMLILWAVCIIVGYLIMARWDQTLSSFSFSWQDFGADTIEQLGTLDHHQTEFAGATARQIELRAQIDVGLQQLDEIDQRMSRYTKHEREVLIGRLGKRLATNSAYVAVARSWLEIDRPTNVTILAWRQELTEAQAQLETDSLVDKLATIAAHTRRLIADIGLAERATLNSEAIYSTLKEQGSGLPVGPASLDVVLSQGGVVDLPSITPVLTESEQTVFDQRRERAEQAARQARRQFGNADAI